MKFKSMIAGIAVVYAAPAAMAQDTIKIGLTGALTGPVAGTYAPAVEGLRLYLDGVNAAGGIGGRSVELILQDDGAEPSRAAANSKRFLTQDGVVVMINASLSSTYAPAIAEAKRAGVPLIFSASACPPEVFPPADPNLFCTTGFGPKYDSQAALAFIEATDGTDVQIGFQAMAIPVSRGEIDYAETLAGEMGMTPVAKEITPPPAPDYSPFASNIENAGAEWVWSWAPWVAQVKTFEALRRLGWEGDYVLYSHLEAEGELERIKDAGLYAIGANAMFSEGLPVMEEIASATEAAGSSYEANQMTEGWIAGMVIEAALSAAEDPGDAASVRDALSSVSVDTEGLRGGPLEWTEDNHFRTVQSYRVYRWNTDSGQIETVRDWTSYDVQ
ncbi:ABC transporter substrate-binding protein [Pseudoruegeria sp. HB172150]|uniref:ABC transporter substrate-binding protein n=1 Tax=Pseudoruegeria sp. HB172150 TaxID=2721164 RepID=UPI0015566F03|nr:ABC transporter substrate-binding protein [Pseudoruegeria sp. HB172150]